MVDSRAKGSRGEYIVRDLLRQFTGLDFERVPNSGALSYLKGDLYVPNRRNRFCIEVKNYEESPLSDKIFTNKSNYLVKWWEKIVQQQMTNNKNLCYSLSILGQKFTCVQLTSLVTPRSTYTSRG